MLTYLRPMVLKGCYKHILIYHIGVCRIEIYFVVLHNERNYGAGQSLETGPYLTLCQFHCYLFIAFQSYNWSSQRSQYRWSAQADAYILSCPWVV